MAQPLASLQALLGGERQEEPLQEWGEGQEEPLQGRGEGQEAGGRRQGAALQHEEEVSSQDLQNRLARLRSVSPRREEHHCQGEEGQQLAPLVVTEEDRATEREGQGQQEEGAEHSAWRGAWKQAAEQLTQEQAMIIDSLPRELQETEILFLLSKDSETRDAWVRQPSLLRRQAAAKRMHTRTMAAATKTGEETGLQGGEEARQGGAEV